MFKTVKMSLADMLGSEYTRAVSGAAKELLGIDAARAAALIHEEIDFLPEKRIEKVDKLLASVGSAFLPSFDNDNKGATTQAYESASNLQASPLGGVGCLRLGQDGKLYLAAKSEHYQSSLGHNFAGYKLIDKARELGIVNATHNNTRGYITRFAETEIIRTINGLAREQDAELERVIASKEPKVLNRVLNLETGSLACEAALKMMFTRFYKIDKTFPERKYAGKKPVFLVIADNRGGREANYHGTTMIAQTFRDLWPELLESFQSAYEVVPVKINDIEDFRVKMDRYNQAGYKTAGFIHEIVLMNYGGISLTKDFLQEAYRLCAEFDTPTMADEIQSCMWYSGLYLFRHYGLKPDFVILGKGFSGGESPASKVVTTYEMDSLNQFGALVTNGQEELASLAYLITMEFVQQNGAEIDRIGAKLDALGARFIAKYPEKIARIEGRGHLVAIHFREIDQAVAFTKRLNRLCIDTSSQTYKANCPPAALFKLPVIASDAVVDFLYEKMAMVLEEL